MGNSSLVVLGYQRSGLLDPHLSFQWFLPAISMQVCQSPVVLTSGEMLEWLTENGSIYGV